MSFTAGPVGVTVPATSANLGPGYDTLGLALDLRDTLHGEVLDEGLIVEVEGEGAAAVPRDERHLVVRSMRAAFDVMGEQPPGLRISCTNRIPHARGLGSSSAAIVGGIALARALVDDGTQRLDDHACFTLAARLEGHPDNVGPAWFGGFVVAGADDEVFFALRREVDARISAVVLVPPTGVETTLARGLLPDQVTHTAAAANAGRAALLVAALTGAPDELFRATRDLLHQEYRRPAMPATLELVDLLRGRGVPAVVSGAGPTVLAFVGEDRSGGDGSAAALLARCPAGWSSQALRIDPRGVLVGG